MVLRSNSKSRKVSRGKCYFYKYEEAQEEGIKKALEIILEKGE